jgi:hypothetical protein
MSALAACLAACSGRSDAGDECAGATRSALVGGTTDPADVQLDEARANAVARLTLRLAPGGQRLDCSAVVIGERLAASAAHCTRGREVLGGELAIGRDADAPIERLPIARVERHPELDLIAVELASPVAGTPGALSPLPVLALSREAGELIEGELLLAGYGQGDDGRLGTRAFLVEPVHAVAEQSVTVTGSGETGACLGDSGGPLLARVQGGELVAIGVLSRGSASCVGLDQYVRLDAALAWLIERGARIHDGATELEAVHGDVDTCR